MQVQLKSPPFLVIDRESSWVAPWDYDFEEVKILDNSQGSFWTHAFKLGQSIMSPKSRAHSGPRVFVFKRLPSLLKWTMGRGSSMNWLCELGQEMHCPWASVSLRVKLPFPRHLSSDQLHQNRTGALRTQSPVPVSEILVRQVWGRASHLK